ASSSASTQARAEPSRSTVRTGGAGGGPLAVAVPRAVSAPASAISTGIAYAARQVHHWVTAPATGLTTIHASAFAPVTYPLAQARAGPANTLTPANPAVSWLAKASPTRTWAARN